MIILDTNVLSELMRASIAAPVERWAAGRPTETLFTTVITQAEILTGLATMSGGKRRDMLASSAQALFDHRLRDRVLPFDSAAARAFAIIMGERRRMGRPISIFDAQIAAIARSTGASVATRDVKDFADCGVAVIDPWAA